MLGLSGVRKNVFMDRATIRSIDSSKTNEPAFLPLHSASVALSMSCFAFTAKPHTLSARSALWRTVYWFRNSSTDESTILLVKEQPISFRFTKTVLLVKEYRQPALGWPSANESWIDIVAASGSSPSPEKDQPSSSPSQLEHTVKKCFQIVVVEDNKADVFLVEQAMSAYEILADFQVITDGEEAIRRIKESKDSTAAWIPDLFLLDLNLPKRSGHEVLACIRQSANYGRIPVLIMTSSDSERDRQEAMRLGASGYFLKPNHLDKFLTLGVVVKDLLNIGRL